MVSVLADRLSTVVKVLAGSEELVLRMDFFEMNVRVRSVMSLLEDGNLMVVDLTGTDDSILDIRLFVNKHSRPNLSHVKNPSRGSSPITFGAWKACQPEAIARLLALTETPPQASECSY